MRTHGVPSTLDAWVEQYKTERPHQSRGDRTPAERFRLAAGRDALAALEAVGELPPPAGNAVFGDGGRARAGGLSLTCQHRWGVRGRATRLTSLVRKRLHPAGQPVHSVEDLRRGSAEVDRRDLKSLTSVRNGVRYGFCFACRVNEQPGR